MKKVRSGKRKDKLIKPIAVAGAIVLVVCLVTCIFHVLDLRNSLETEINNQLSIQLEVASNVLSDEIEKTEEIVDVIAREMEERQKSTLSDSQIYQVLKKYKPISDLQKVAYISADGVAYYDDGCKVEVDPAYQEKLKKVTESSIYVCDDFRDADGEYMILYINVVKDEGGKEGFLTGIKSCRDILDSNSFHYLKEIGDVIVVNKEGVILDCNFINLQNQKEPYATIYDCMEQWWQVDDEKIGELRNMITNKGISEGMIQTEKAGQEERERYFYSFSAVENSPDMAIILMYSDRVFADVENTIIVGSVIFCTVMFISMVIMVFLAYRHNASASQIITKLAFDDDITGGKNLNYFKEFATDILYKYQGMPFTMHRFDVSNFRYINEAYGHVRADQLLRIIIEEAGAIFYNKEMCVRMNADQFVLLTKNTQDLEERFFVFTDKVNARALDIGIRYPIKFKRGVYQIKNEEYDIALIIDKANAARKNLTGEEKDSVFYYSDKLVSDMRKVDKIESEMEAALFNNEFKMFIQPKWDIKEDKLYGGEALVRWMKEDGTMVYPSDFVPVFEKNGFVEQLDIHMLEMACQLIRNLLDSGRPAYPISVNQSRLLLHNPAYISRVSEMLRRYNIPKEYIELEITETVFFTEREKMITILNELKAREVLLSMDDFGSGYSSLNMLKDFPFDVLKIDKEFFSESITSESSTWILRKIIEMAEGLGIRVICEGVETKKQVEMLQQIGCRYVQGYYYSKPIPAERFVELYCRESA